jgi:hypothetical protein
MLRRVVWQISSNYRPDDGSSKLLWNVGQYLSDDTAQHPRRQLSTCSPPWESEISMIVIKFEIVTRLDVRIQVYQLCKLEEDSEHLVPRRQTDPDCCDVFLTSKLLYSVQLRIHRTASCGNSTQPGTTQPKCEYGQVASCWSAIITATTPSAYTSGLETFMLTFLSSAWGFNHRVKLLVCLVGNRWVLCIHWTQ